MTHIKKFLLGIIVLTSAPIMQAQDYIKEFSDFLSDTSIVRSISKDKFLIYSNKFPKSSFILIDGDLSTGTVPVLHLNDYTYIKDFHIYGDMVYFCGFETSGQGTEAIVGYFKLPTFPSCQVFYYTYPSALSFNKLDIYQVLVAPFERHVVMTATVSSSESSIVDAHPYSSTQWSFERCIMLPDSEVFDDVTVRDSTVAFSTRCFDSTGLVTGRIWYFAKPTVIGTSIFNTSLHKQIITYPVPSSPIWMEKCPGDKLAITYGTDDNRCLVVSSMNMVAGNPLVMLDFDFPWLAKDIKFNSFSSELEVMVTKYPYNHTRERIYQFTSSMFSGFYGGNANYHEYRASIDRLCSFDYMSSTGDAFIVSGYDNTDNALSFYKYTFGIWNNCTEKKYDFAVPFLMGGKAITDYIPFIAPDRLEVEIMHTRTENIDYYTICH